MPALGGVIRLLWPFVVFGLFSQARSPYRFDLWTADEGLPQNVIRGIRQTADGYLWLSTPNGLVRFDGIRFTVFDKSTSPGIISNRFTSIYLDAKGDLWFGTENSGVTRYHQGSFTTYTTAHGLPNNSVGAITGDEAGHVWALAQGYIAQWQDDGAGRFVKLPLSDPNYPWRPLLWEGEGFWAPDSRCLHFFLKGRLSAYALPSGLPMDSIPWVAQDRAGTIWLETRDGKHFRVVGDHIRREPSAAARQETIFSYRDRQGNLVPFVAGRHLYRSILCSSPSNQIEKIFFAHLFEDREGNVWLGSDGQGLCRLRPQVISVYSREQGLIDNNVYPVFQDHAGAVWIGAWQRGLSRFQNGIFTNYTPRDGLPSELVTALAEDRGGHLWVAGHGGLRTLLNKRFQEPANFQLSDQARIQAMQQDREGTFWFGTTLGLLCYENGTRRFFTTREGLAGNDVHVVVESAAGDLWIGGSGGLTRRHNGQFARWTERDGLPPGIVRSIYIDSDGVVWIGTYDGGLGRFQNGKLIRYTTREGLFNNGVFQILEDERGYFWMSCNRGIYRVSKRELNEVAAGLRNSVVSVHYGRSDGLLNVECNGGLWPAGIKARDSTLWFPTQGGVAVVDPALVAINPQPPPVVIESALLDSATLPLDRPLQVTPGKESLEIRYTALSFVRSPQIQFKYKLEGLESAWVDAGSRRAAYYSHMPPGEYVFRVIARNSDGVWNNQGASLNVRVLAPFYWTWWFQLLVFACAVAMARGVWRYRVSQLERAQTVQRAFSRQLIASQENERKRIAAELHDSLGQRLVVLKNLALFALRTQKKDAGGEWVNSMQEISDEAASAIEETRQISYNLRPFQLDRLGLTKVIEGMIRTVSAASGIPISSQLDNIDDVFPEELRINFYRILQECLNNMMKYAQASEAGVRIQRGKECLLLTVEDDGCGFTPGIHHMDAGRGGFGLTGMAERARLLGGKLTVQSEPGHGTIITVAIRCGEKNHD